MSDQENKKESYWLIAFTVIPIVLLGNLASSLDWQIPRALIAGLLGGIGGALGTGIYYLSKERSTLMRGVIFGLFITAILLVFLLVDAEKMSTCEACGYIAVEIKGEDCNVCYAAINEEEMNFYENVSLEELISEEQLFFFSNDEQVISFEEPTIYIDDILEEEFKKDKNWEPIISWSDVQKVKAKNE